MRRGGDLVHELAEESHAADLIKLLDLAQLLDAFFDIERLEDRRLTVVILYPFFRINNYKQF